MTKCETCKCGAPLRQTGTPVWETWCSRHGCKYENARQKELKELAEKTVKKDSVRRAVLTLLADEGFMEKLGGAIEDHEWEFDKTGYLSFVLLEKIIKKAAGIER